jgi:hypothetical protein
VNIIIPILAILWLGLYSTHSIAGPIEGAAIDSAIKSEAPIIARQWGLTPIFRISDGVRIEMTRNGVLELGREGFKTVLAKVDVSQHRYVVRWIIAHETWHQVQRRDLESVQLGDPRARRRRECEADILASHYTTESLLQETNAEMDMSKAKLLGSVVKSVVGEVQAAERDFSGSIDHPSPDQRRTAITLGNMRGFIGHLNILADEEERESVSIQMRRILDYRDNENLSDWAFRKCGMIINDGDGINDLIELPRKIEFNKGGNPPVVDFQLPYRNIGPYSLNIDMQVMTVAVPRESPEDIDSWLKVDAMNFSFEIAPGEEYILTGRLFWAATIDAHPRLVFPMARGSLYNATRSAANVESSKTHPRSQLSPRLSRLAASLLMIANAATDQFKSIRGQPCRNIRGSKSCPLTIVLPSSEEAEVNYEADGATNVDITLYAGKSASDAESIFVGFKNDLKAIDPFKIYAERKTSSGGTTLTYSPTSTSRFNLHFFKSSSGTYHVSVIIAPTAYFGN